MAKATVEELNAQILELVEEKDKYLSKFRKETVALTKTRDDLVAAEEAVATVADMTEAEKKAIAAELGKAK